MFRMSRSLSVALAALYFALPAWTQELPEGKGKEIAAAKCGACHALQARVGSGYTVEGWTTVLRMMTNHGVPLSQEEIATLTPYLAKNFPVTGRPDAALVPGPVKVSMKAWPVSTPGARPHDPLAAKDGNIWYTGNTGALIGRLDPKTGAVTEYKMPDPEAKDPHTLLFDRNGIL